MPSFSFEKIRTLTRSKRVELLEGTISGRRYIIKRIVARHNVWPDFLLQSSVQNPLFLPPHFGGFDSRGDFCCAMLLNFVPLSVSEDADFRTFLVQFLSFAQALRSRGLVFVWDAAHLFMDKNTKRIYLAGLAALHEAPSPNCMHHEANFVNGMRNYLGRFKGASPLVDYLRKWERRKRNLLNGSFMELLADPETPLDLTLSFFEWSRSRELELVAGLFQLAERSRGRSVIFEAEAGGGKSNLIRQIHRTFVPRQAIVSFFQAQKEERPYHSIRKWLDGFFEQIGGFRNLKNDPTLPQWRRFIDGSADFTEEILAANFLQLIEKLDVATVILFDDLHNFDEMSISLVQRLIRQIQSYPVLLVATSRENLQLSELAVTLTLEQAPMRVAETHVHAPFWKNEQRNVWLKHIYDRTSGNPQLFQEYLAQTFRTKQPSLRWTEDGWFFSARDIPALPEALLEFYLEQIPELSESERLFLETASVQGEIFDTKWMTGNGNSRLEVLDGLVQKGIVLQTNGKCTFRKPLLAEALYQRIEPERLRNFHRSLAVQMTEHPSPDMQGAIARHFLKGGDYSRALLLATSYPTGGRSAPAELVLPILEELEDVAHQLTDSEQLRLHTEIGRLLSHKGNFPAAVEAFDKALQLSPGDGVERFSLALSIANAHLLNQDYKAAQKIFHDQANAASLVKDEKLLFQFYLARGVCSWHRGERQQEDFDMATQIAERQQDYDALARAYYQRGELQMREGALEEAALLGRKAIRYARKTGNQDAIGNCFRLHGALAWRRSKYRVAEKSFKRSIRILERAGNQEGVARAWNSLGNIYMEKYSFADAMRAFQNAVQIFNQLNHQLEVSLAQFSIGLIHTAEARFKDAEKIFARCCEVDRKSGNKRYYAYDLRALAVVCHLRGFYKKAMRLLKRATEIFQQMRAEGDVLQTKLLFTLNELEQKNYLQLTPVIESLQSRLPELSEPMTQAEIHYLCGHFYGYTHEIEKAICHLNKSLEISRKIHYHKLIGKSLILRLIFHETTPARNEADLKLAFRSFRRAGIELEFSDYLLKLYEAYPAMLQEKEHARKLVWMERLYRRIHHRPKHHRVRQLSRQLSAPRKVSVEPLYDWWQNILQILTKTEPLDLRLQRLLAELIAELHSSFGLVQYLNDHGIYERVTYPDVNSTNVADDLAGKVFERLARQMEKLCVDLTADPEFSRCRAAIVDEVRSVIAIPIQKDGQLIGMWYLERRGSKSVFSRKEAAEAAFFAMAIRPTMEEALQQEFARRGGQYREAIGTFPDLIGNSKPMAELYRQMQKVAPLDLSVLIVGETGTGKELIARSLHRNSRRASGPFQALNCSALPETLIESELFGYNRGAFTGATAVKPGLIERANGGTLFLDEVGDLSPAAQAKLLRVMQEREIQRLGDTAVRKVDVRFIFATHKDLKRLVKEGAYRQDLFYRISVYSLRVPALRERGEDISLLVGHFLNRYCLSFGKSGVRFSGPAMRMLCDYSWPGNVREMENVIQTVLVNCESGAILETSDLPSDLSGRPIVQRFAGMSLDEGRNEFEREFLQQALNRNRWNKTHAARELKVTRQGLINMIQRLGIEQPE